MTTLAGMQAALQRALCGDDRDVELLVVSDGRLDAARRVAIYRHACVTRLVGALAEAYPALRQALGERRFEDLAREYVAAHPSRSASIRWFGREIAPGSRDAVAGKRKANEARPPCDRPAEAPVP